MTRPLFLGHRGARASRQIAENTLASFELCLRHGCDGFEFDVRLSADGQAVICHDATVGAMKIEKTASKSLALPTLEDVLGQFAQRAFLDIELKVAGLAPQTVAVLRKHPPQKGYVVSSFLPDVLTTIHDLDPAIPLGFLCETRHQLRCWREMPAEWVIPQFKLADGGLVELVRAAGKRIMVWTVNGTERMREFAVRGVDAIISDETELMVRSLQ
ncbi:MAG: glycerophosphodiester phosphodiesterase [Terriglobales bacterium]|jgi:glycerophosphoryl diester phosphodiesterase